MPDMKDPSPEAFANVTEHNVETRAELLPEEQSTGGSADPDLAQVEGLALDGPLLGVVVVDLPRHAHVGEVGAGAIDQDADVRHPSRQLTQDRQDVGLRAPLGDLAHRRVHQRLVQDHRPVRGDDHRPAPQRAGRTAFVALQQPAPDRLDHRLGGTLLGQPLGHPADAQLQFGVGVLVGVGDVGALGGRAAHQVPAERALVAAAVTTKAAVVVLPRSAMPGDIPVAAVLRWTDASTPS